MNMMSYEYGALDQESGERASVLVHALSLHVSLGIILPVQVLLSSSLKTLFGLSCLTTDLSWCHIL